MVLESVAIYGAILSTVAILWKIYSYILDKPKIRVNNDVGISSIMPGQAEEVLLVTAVNHGKRPVTLSSIGIYTEGELNFLPPLINWNLPKKLGEGESHTVCYNLNKSIKHFKKYSPIYSWFKDQTGEVYKSKKNIKKLLKNF